MSTLPQRYHANRIAPPPRPPLLRCCATGPAKVQVTQCALPQVHVVCGGTVHHEDGILFAVRGESLGVESIVKPSAVYRLPRLHGFEVRKSLSTKQSSGFRRGFNLLELAGCSCSRAARAWFVTTIIGHLVATRAGFSARFPCAGYDNAILMGEGTRAGIEVSSKTFSECDGAS